MKKRILHLGGFCDPLPCNGSLGGATTKRTKEVTCNRCKKMIANGKIIAWR